MDWQGELLDVYESGYASAVGLYDAGYKSGCSLSSSASLVSNGGIVVQFKSAFPAEYNSAVSMGYVLGTVSSKHWLCVTIL